MDDLNPENAFLDEVYYDEGSPLQGTDMHGQGSEYMVLQGYTACDELTTTGKFDRASQSIKDMEWTISTEQANYFTESAARNLCPENKKLIP